jgi:hypothetical protein
MPAQVFFPSSGIRPPKPSFGDDGVVGNDQHGLLTEPWEGWDILCRHTCSFQQLTGNWQQHACPVTTDLASRYCC